MATTYPYVSGFGPLQQIFTQLRRRFPKSLTADALKKLGIAKNNESYVLSTLKFLGIVTEDGATTEEAKKAFTNHKEEAFQEAFAKLVKTAYSGLFELHGEDAWKLESDNLIQYFRTADGTSAIVGRRQATTFTGLSAIAGHVDAPPMKGVRKRKKKAKAAPKKKAAKKKAAKKKAAAAARTTTERTVTVGAEAAGGEVLGALSGVGLTVRVEINLPADANQQTYDRIFKSIRANLIDA